MSNKAKRRELVPKLRFPEYREERAWEVEPLGKLCEVLNSRRKPISSNDRVSGPYPYYGASGIVDYVNDYIFDERLLLVGEDGAKWGAYERTAFIAEGKYWVNNHAHVLKPFGVQDTLLESYLTMLDLGPFVAGAAPPKLTLGKLKEVPVPVPLCIGEQQMIADCLASLDELINREAQTLDSLNSHKKGLMQQLFPTEGETLPKLRFPEFRETGQWEELPIGGKVDLLSGYPFDGADITEDVSGVPLMRGINVTEGFVRHSPDIDRYFLGDAKNLDKYRLRVDDLVIGMDGSKVGKNSALISESDVDALLVQRVARLRAKRGATIGFIFQHINSHKFHAYVERINTSGGIPHISAKQIGEFKICFPSAAAEQQRIADCLASLDDLIAAKAKRLSALKRHKKGLMQQLFPTLDEVQG